MSDPAQRKINLDQLLQVTQDLPATPQLIPRLQRMLYDPDTDMKDIFPLVKLDASITSGVIRMANSAYFRGVEPVLSLEEAVSRLGLFELYRIVCLVVAEQVMGSPLPLYNLKKGELLVSSISAALAMEVLAERLRQEEIDGPAGYTIGLLHSLGKIVVNRHYVNYGLKLYDDAVEIDPVIERKILGFEHAELGSALLEKWGFPEALFGPVLFQNHPLTAKSFQPSACMLHLSLKMGAAVQDEQNVKGKPNYGAVLPVLEFLGLAVEEMDDLLKTMRKHWSSQKALVNAIR